MTDRTQDLAVKLPVTGATGKPLGQAYDRRSLTYSNTFDNGFKRNVIRTIEWMTGKIRIMRMLRTFRRNGPHPRETFWRATLDVMGIDLLTPADQIARIPVTGPVIVVANHPHGLVDGMVMADLLARVRTDFKVLTRSILTGIDDTAASYLIPVPFPHEDDAQQKGLDMRTAAMDTLNAGGVIALFPSGVVATSPTLFGTAVEAEWNVFTAKMIRRSGATILPVYFPGSNSRLYQIANRLSPTLRQSLLLHEIVAACKKPQAPVVGTPIPAAQIEAQAKDPRAFMAWLRDHTLSLRS